jgi:protein SCO1/2
MLKVLPPVALLLSLVPLPAAAHDHGASSAGAAAQQAGPALSGLARTEKARNYFTDLPVVAQDGKERRFFSDVLQDKVVLIYLFYTNCTSVCPVMHQKLAEVQDLIADRLGKDITLISITTDPERDTPAVVKTYAEFFHPRAGWLFLTGDKQNIETIVRRLGHTSSDPTDHVALLNLGNVGTGKWTKVRPTASEAEIAATLQLLAGEVKE